jgi:hypothetical protein
MDRRGLATSMRRPFRAIALYFGLRKQAMHESGSRLVRSNLGRCGRVIRSVRQW